MRALTLLPHCVNQAVNGWCETVYALVQTTGLMCMVYASVDANLHVRRRPVLAATVALAIVAFAVLEALADGLSEDDLVSEESRRCSLCLIQISLRV